MQEFGLSFGTKEEYEFRFELYKQKDAEINEINAREKNFRVGHNKFSTMTKYEAKKLNGFKYPPASHMKEPTYLETDNLTDSVDWRTKGAVNPVKDQA
jgi:cathepsin L